MKEGISSVFHKILCGAVTKGCLIFAFLFKKSDLNLLPKLCEITDAFELTTLMFAQKYVGTFRFSVPDLSI